VTGAPGVPDIGELLRELAPQVLGALARRYGEFGACEEAVQEAMLEAVASPGPGPDRDEGQDGAPGRRSARRGRGSCCTSST
jgi:hypothetical protein